MSDREEVVLMAKIDKDGKLTSEFPKNKSMAALLLLHLQTVIQSEHLMTLQMAAAKENATKPKIIV
jgi:hypothetical protein